MEHSDHPSNNIGGGHHRHSSNHQRASSTSGFIPRRDFSAYNYPPGIFGPAPPKVNHKVGKVYNGLVVDLKEQQVWAGSGSMTSKARWTSPKGQNNNAMPLSSRHSSNVRINRRKSELERDHQAR